MPTHSSGDATVLIVTTRADDSPFLGALLGEELPLLAYPCPVVIAACKGPGQAKVYWKDSRTPEDVSEEALQAESEQLLYCCSEMRELSEEKRRWLKEIRCIRIERDNRLLRGGLRLILLTVGYGNLPEQFQAIAPSFDAAVFVGPGLGALDALGQRFLSNYLYGARRQDVFFVMDRPDFREDEQSGLLPHYLAPVFAGKGGVVDGALLTKRVFHMDAHAAARARAGKPHGLPPAHAGKPRGLPPAHADPETAGSGMAAFEAELFAYLNGKRLLADRVSDAPVAFLHSRIV
jgi:hypothetical protein